MSRSKPLFLLAGGPVSKPGGMKSLLRDVLAATGREKPIVAHIGVANGDNRTFCLFTAALLKKAGAGAVTPVKLAREQADAVKAKAVLKAADAVFISGGDVEEGMRWLNHYRLGAFLRGLQRSGVLFFGISAGSIMLGTQWVRWRDPKDDATAELFPCLGLAPILCDTHAEQDGWEELKVAVALLGEKGRGYGIPAGGAIRAGGDGVLTALVKPAICFENRSGRVARLNARGVEL